MSSNSAPSSEPPLTGDASVLSGADALLDIFARGITHHYARQLVEARDSGDQAEITRVMNCIAANHPDPASVGRAAVLLTLQGR